MLIHFAYFHRVLTSIVVRSPFFCVGRRESYVGRRKSYVGRRKSYVGRRICYVLGRVDNAASMRFSLVSCVVQRCMLRTIHPHGLPFVLGACSLAHQILNTATREP